MSVLLDLDNTLVDRDGAFSRWAGEAVPTWGGGEADVEWLVRADAHGYAPRAQLAGMIIDRLEPGMGVDGVVARLLYEHVDCIECYPGVLPRLTELAGMGEALVVVTNGESRQQRMKLQRTGLAEILTGSVISGEVGFKKPDPRIFTAARGIAPSGTRAWMVGDHVEADIAGGRAAGLATAWVAHGRPWTEPWTPTAMAPTTAEVLASIASSTRSTG